MPIDTPNRNELSNLYDELYNLGDDDNTKPIDNPTPVPEETNQEGASLSPDDEGQYHYLEVISEDLIGEHQQLLENILKATGLERSEIKIIEGSVQDPQKEESACDFRLLFKSQSTKVGHILQGEVQCLVAPPLSQINNNKGLKMELWKGLKKLLAID